MDPLELSFAVDVPVAHAFETWATKTGLWWPRDHTVSGETELAVTVEPWVGGRIYERTSGGREHDWGEVVAWEPPHRLVYLWHLMFDRRDATEVEIAFTPEGSATTVTIRHRGWERLGADAAPRRARTRLAWQAIIPHYERGARAALERRREPRKTAPPAAKRVRVGLLGCGRIVRLFHLRALATLDEVELVALAESDPVRLERASARVPGALRYGDYRELLEQSDVDAVVIALPTSMHAEATATALERGKHVYVEKPLATSSAEARPVLESWRHSGAVARIGFNLRFHPLYESARRALHAGAIGELVAARSVLCSAPRDLPAWKRSPASGGGALLDLASHHLDMACFLLGQEIRDVSAVLRSVRTEEDTAMLTCRLADSTTVQGLFSTSALEEDRFEIYGDRGKLVVDRYRARDVERVAASPHAGRADRLRRAAMLARQAPLRLRDVLLPPAEHSFAAALASFAGGILRGTTDERDADLDDGYRSLLAVDAARESARAGRPVVLAAAGRGKP